MQRKSMITACSLGILALAAWGAASGENRAASRSAAKRMEMQPIGVIRTEGRSPYIEVDPRFEDALLGLEGFSHVWVYWWFDRNDTPEKRSVLRVHPRGDSRNPLTGVFATRSPARPNLIAMTLCRVESIERNRIRVETIDAFDQTPVVDLKPYIPGLDRAEDVRVPRWAGVIR